MKRILLFLLFSYCATAFGQTAFEREIFRWDSNRVVYLKSEGGWLNLAGLYWLEEGNNTFGSGSDNDIRFPAGSIPELFGRMIQKNDRVSLETFVPVRFKGSMVTQALLLERDSLSGPTIDYGKWRWNLIRRDGKIAIRLRQLNHPALQGFHSIPRYKADSSWCVKAKLVRRSTGSISITNVLGQTNMQASPGVLEFTIKGIKYTLDALVEGNQLFIIFTDSTTGLTTYASGRYLYATMPDASGNTMLDFNKAFNPPCAFTAFATCPLPPPQNNLNLAVEAGEKDYH
jgi:uncharacterized protein (DUF1684 family)